ncbi:hypothetical protein QT621_24885, partial [Xanthomonas citri pv. citri]
YDPRNILNTESVIAAAGGKATISKSGHSFIKQVMRENNAVYGGEMSAHHYFRDFNYCDSGMIPWLLVIELLSKSGKTEAPKKLSQLVDEMIAAFPISGEINFKLDGITAPAVLAKLEDSYPQFDSQTATLDKLDGLSVNFPRWRFNVRASNTEPLIRLNVEASGDKTLLDEKTKQLLMQAGGLLAGVAASKVGDGDAAAAVMLGSQAISANAAASYSRGQEREADRIGMQIMNQAGYDVNAMPSF